MRRASIGPEATGRVMRQAAGRSGGGRRSSKPPRQGPSRIAKRQLLDRIKRDTTEVRAGSLLGTLRRQGYEELALEDIQDRMSKVHAPLGDFLLSRRG